MYVWCGFISVFGIVTCIQDTACSDRLTLTNKEFSQSQSTCLSLIVQKLARKVGHRDQLIIC